MGWPNRLFGGQEQRPSERGEQVRQPGPLPLPTTGAVAETMWMKQALGVALAAVMLWPVAAGAAEDPHPAIVPDATWCARMLPGKDMATARKRCVSFIANINAISRGAALGRKVTQGKGYVLPDAIIAALAWNDLTGLGVREGKAYAEWSSDPDPTPTPTPKPTPTPEAMLRLADGLSYRWLDRSEYKPEYDTGFSWGMLVRADSVTCEHLYVEVSISNRDGVIVGNSVDGVTGLARGTTARLRFSWLEEGGGTKTARVVDVQCYEP